MARTNRTPEEVIAAGLDAIGGQIDVLAAKETLDTYEGKLLCEYVKAACAVSKNDRENALAEKVGELSDDDLERLLTDEVRQNPKLLKRLIDKAKVDLAKIS